METGKIRSVTIGARGTGTGSDNMTFTVGSQPIGDRSDSMRWGVSEIEGYEDEDGSSCYIYKEKDGEKILKFKAIDQPMTYEYDDPVK